MSLAKEDATARRTREQELLAEEAWMDPCCARERQDRRRASRLMRQLRASDRSMARLDLRQEVLKRCGGQCCVARNLEAVDYPALAQLRLEEGPLLSPAAGDTEAEPDLVDSDQAASDSDAELDEMMAELEDADPELKRLQAEQRAEAERHAAHVEVAHSSGFGVHRPVAASAALSMVACRPLVVCHLCDARSLLAARMDLFLEAEALRWPGTCFVRVEPTTSSPARDRLLAQLGLRSSTVGGGALVACKLGDVVAKTEQLDLFGDDGFLAAEAVRQWLQHSGVLSSVLPGLGSLQAAAASQQDAEEEEEEEYFDCGRPGCQKAFAHEHISAQDGSSDLPLL